MRICSVIVSYDNRFNLLSRVVNSLLNERIDKIVIVDNGSVDESRLKIEAMQSKYKSTIIVHRLDHNEGSAKGFKKGLEVAVCTDCDFIWILDDDNNPVQGALSSLKNFWISNVDRNKTDITALCSLRSGRPNFLDAVKKNDARLILQTKNNFAGFHIRNFFLKLKERLLPSPRHANDGMAPALKLNATAYGGLFFHKNLLQHIQLPDENYVLYSDDFAFTYQIPLNGGEIWLVSASKVEDLEASHYLPLRKKFLYHSVFDAKTDATVYYSFRNSIYFSKKYLLDNHAVRFINKMLFLLMISVMGVLRGKIGRLKVLREAIRDAEAGRIMVNPKYSL
jgi:GT2 family glycosyltransferase